MVTSPAAEVSTDSNSVEDRGGGGGGGSSDLSATNIGMLLRDGELRGDVTVLLDDVIVVVLELGGGGEARSFGGLMEKEPGLVGDLGLAVPDRTRLIVGPGVTLPTTPPALTVATGPGRTTGLGSSRAELRLGECMSGEVGGVFMELKKAERAACFCVAKSTFSTVGRSSGCPLTSF